MASVEVKMKKQRGSSRTAGQTREAILRAARLPPSCGMEELDATGY
jgi:hypothetical protein